MFEVAAYSTFAMTIGVVLARPVRVPPAAAVALGALALFALGALGVGDVRLAAVTLARPLVTVASIMILTASAAHAGVIDALAGAIERRAALRSAARVHVAVFALASATAAILNNDSAVLLLTPLVVSLVRRLWPDRPALVVPFAFAVFLAAGVAPLVVSNPMNMIVAATAGLDFNAYARVMLPVSLAVAAATCLALHLVFRRELRAAPAARAATTSAPRARMLPVLIVVLATLPAYPLVALAHGPVWLVALAGALAAALLTARGDALPFIARAPSYEILGFLAGVFTLSLGLRNAGLVTHLAAAYDHASAARIGVTSALGSAIVNNHPMAILNVLALQSTGAGRHQILAALVGGDLGPRLLPIGSLAGLLWLESLRRQRVAISLARFVGVGVLVTIPALIAALVVL